MNARISLALLVTAMLLVPTHTRAAEAAAERVDVPKIVSATASYESGKNAAPLRLVEALVSQSAQNKGLRQQLETELARLLTGNATFEAKRFACQQLAVVGSDAVLPAIAELLKQDETVGIACLALGSTPSVQANATLRHALGTARSLSRIQILHTLGDRRDAQAVPVLAELARDPDPATAGAAIISLGKIGTPPAAEVLGLLRRDNNPAIKAVAVEASLYAADQLAAEGKRKIALAIYQDLFQPAQEPEVQRAAFEALLRLEPKNAEDRILTVLRGSDAALKPAAIAGVRSLKSRKASSRFAQELPGLPPGEQVLLLDSLAARGDRAAGDAISASLASNNATVRRSAAVALGRAGDASSVPALTEALGRAPTDVERQVMVLVMAGLPGGSAVDKAIIAALQSKQTVPRASLVEVLGKRGNQLAIPALLSEAGNPDPATAKAAFQALGKLATPDDLVAMLDTLAMVKNPPARTHAVAAIAQTISRTPEPTRSAAVCGALGQTTDLETRCTLLGLLPTCGGGPAMAVLLVARLDSEPRVCDAAIRSLAEWPDMTAWDTLIKIYRQAASDTHRVLALRGLVRLAAAENPRVDAALIEKYRQLMAGAKSDDDRKLILGALGSAAHPGALQLALPCLEQAGLRAEAELAVKKIAESVKAQHPQAAQDALQQLNNKQ